MACEAWPLSRRSQHSVDIKVEENLAIHHLYESGDPIPIIPVEGTPAWRPGGQQMVYLGFNGLMGDRFALAFDEPRLFEAVAVFLKATGVYENSTLSPMVAAEKIEIQSADEGSLLKVKIKGGASIALHLSNETLASLKKLLGFGSEVK